MPIDKVVVLARGLGTRMRRADASAALDERQAAMAATGVKALIPMGRPFLDYVLTALADAGYRRVCLVIGPEQHALRAYYGRDVRPQRLAIEFAVQQKPRGTADAVAAAEPFAETDLFAVINSDNYYPVEALCGLRRQESCAVALFERDAMLAGSNVSEERLGRFAVGRIDAGGFLEQIIEKPDRQTIEALPEPLWLSMNCWLFGPTIFEACRAVGPSSRGELELPDAVAHAIDVLGQRFRVLRVRSAVLDLSGRKDVAPVTAMLAGSEVRL